MEEFIHKSCGQSCQVLFAEPSRTWAKDGNRQIVDDDLIIYRQDMTIDYSLQILKKYNRRKFRSETSGNMDS